MVAAAAEAAPGDSVASASTTGTTSAKDSSAAELNGGQRGEVTLVIRKHTQAVTVCNINHTKNANYVLHRVSW